MSAIYIYYNEQAKSRIHTAFDQSIGQLVIVWVPFILDSQACRYGDRTARGYAAGQRLLFCAWTRMIGRVTKNKPNKFNEWNIVEYDVRRGSI